VDEFDLLAGPNNARVRHFPQAANDVSLNLAQTSRVGMDISLDIKRAEVVDAACKVSQTIFTAAVVITNVPSHQTLFYQLRLGLVRAPSKGGAATRLAPNWFFTGTNTQAGVTGQFGFGDNVTSYGQTWTEVGSPHVYHVDMLPRIKWLIAQGARYGLDQDLSHWRVTGTYHGQGIMGHVRNDAVWGQFALNLE
jgi:hypothetical protein